MPEPLFETSVIPDTFVTNIGQIEILNSCARFVFFVDRGGNREIVSKLIVPIENVPSAIGYTVAVLGGHWVVKPVLPLILMPVH